MDGILVINKEKDYTSKDVTSIIRKIFNNQKVGHAGTLDPLATGVLVVAIGKGLKVLEYLSNDDKEYIAEVKMGIFTDTLDITGEVIKEDYNYIFDKDRLKDILKSFLGKSMQEIPIYSSVKVNGKKLYYYARNKEEVELPLREIEIKDIELLEYNNKSFTFRVVVSKGTYVRSLIRDIGKKMDIYCTMSNLKRTRQGEFRIDNSSTLKDLEKGKFQLFPINVVFSKMLIVDADDYLEKRIMNGSLLENRYDKKMIVFQNKDKEIIGIYKVSEDNPIKIKPVKILKSH